jgi:PAS domain-containing protein
LNETKETLDVKASEIELINKELQEIKAYSSGIEKDILENEVFFDLLLHKSPLNIYAHSEGKFIFANNRVAEMYGLSNPHDLIGKSILDYVPEDYRNTVNSYINETYKNIGRVDS